MSREEKVEKCCVSILVAAIGLIFLSICVRLVVKNVVYEKMGIYNEFVHFWLRNDGSVGEENGAEEDATVLVEVDWEALYPFTDTQAESRIRGTEAETEKNAGKKSVISKYAATMENIKQRIDIYSNELLLIQQDAVAIDETYKKLGGWNLYSAQGEDGIIFMKNGYLTKVINEVAEQDIEEIVASLRDFQEFLDEKNIPLLYTQAGTKVCPWDRKLFDESAERSNENGDKLLARLNACGIETVDFREEMKQADLDWYQYYYITDHHWTSNAGLWAAGIISQKLNAEYGFDFDEKYYDTDAYEVTTYENYFLGSWGRRLTLARAELEDYNLIVPRFQTDFTIQIPTRGLERTGSYTDSVFELDAFEKIASYSDMDYLNQRPAYECTAAHNDALATIVNHNPENNQGKKILILSDSFGHYFSTFLACDVEYVDVVHLPAFTGSIRTYIEETDPDLVLIIYSNPQISAIDWKSHSDPYDFR